MQSIVYTSSLGTLKKTVFNQQVVKARAAVTSMSSPTAVKTADFVSRIEAIKKSEEIKKVRRRDDDRMLVFDMNVSRKKSVCGRHFQL